MIGFALAVAFLGSPGACPPDVGQIRWDGYRVTFKAGGKSFVVQGTLWDRKADAKPSSGDLLKIDSATANGDPLPVDALWVVVRGKLAAHMKRQFKRIQSRLKARCESRFEVEGVRRFGSPAALGRYLRKLGSGPRMTPAQRAESDITGWAEELCANGNHIEEDDLRRRLLDRGARRHGAVGKGRLKRISHDVARQYAMRCAHLKKGGKLTFGN